MCQVNREQRQCTPVLARQQRGQPRHDAHVQGRTSKGSEVVCSQVQRPVTGAGAMQHGVRLAAHRQRSAQAQARRGRKGADQ